MSCAADLVSLALMFGVPCCVALVIGHPPAAPPYTFKQPPSSLCCGCMWWSGFGASVPPGLLVMVEVPQRAIPSRGGASLYPLERASGLHIIRCDAYSAGGLDFQAAPCLPRALRANLLSHRFLSGRTPCDRGVVQNLLRLAGSFSDPRYILSRRAIALYLPLTNHRSLFVTNHY